MVLSDVRRAPAGSELAAVTERQVNEVLAAIHTEVEQLRLAGFGHPGWLGFRLRTDMKLTAPSTQCAMAIELLQGQDWSSSKVKDVVASRL